MKLLKQVLILLLCCLLVRRTAQAESFGPTGQSSEQPPAPVQQSPNDIGPNTTKLTQAMNVYDPDSTWHKVE